MTLRFGLPILVATLVLAAVSLAFGVAETTPGAVLTAFTSFDAGLVEHQIIRELRVPRALAAILGGASLGLAGALMQTMTRNPLADPGILGINAGAAFGVVTGIWVLRLSAPGALVAPALTGAAIASLLVLVLGSGTRRGGPDPIRMVLAGAALSALFLSLTWALLILSRQSLDIYRYWVLGGFDQVSPQSLYAVLPLFAAGLGIGGFSAFLLHPLALGDDTARALGARIGLARGVSLLAIVFLCGTTVSLAGPIAFIGLLVPHIVRPFAGGDVRRLALGSAVTGSALAVLADLIGRLILPGQELEAGAILALIGGPILIALVHSKRALRL